MSGRKEETLQSTYLTEPNAYRVNVTVADAAGPAGAADTDIPTIHLDLDPESLVQNAGAGTADQYQSSMHGHGAYLAIYARIPVGTATIQVWALADDDSGVVADFWAFVQENALTRNTLVTLQDLPAGKYKILVTAVSDAIDLLVSQTT